MNCANHPETVSAAFCRTCGKPLCATCTRDVRGVIYCESCLAARMEGTTPPPTVYQPVMDQGMGLKVPPIPGPGPSPGLAGVLSIFPGVGAVYAGQYVKGVVHMGIAIAIIWALSSGAESGAAVVLGLSLGFFWIYQMIDAVRSAKAIQMGQPAPDPFGLANTFGAGEKVDTTKIPVGALVLIGLGALFLLHNMGVWFFSFNRFWPLILIGIGGWLFARRWGLIGNDIAYDCDRCRARGMVGPAVLVTLGLLFLLEQTDVISFGRTWPMLLVVIGLVKVLQGNASTVGHNEGLPPAPGPGPTATVTPEVQPPSSEVPHG
ncbi:MAG: DUF5668 domain-containing protein [Acidobacteriia bacterium]|nr:DUF5668 domain-containing protein [Terriglobia bacterium]